MAIALVAVAVTAGVEVVASPKSVAEIVRFSGLAARSAAVGVPPSVQVPPVAGALLCVLVMESPVPAGKPKIMHIPFNPPMPPVTVKVWVKTAPTSPVEGVKLMKASLALIVSVVVACDVPVQDPDLSHAVSVYMPATGLAPETVHVPPFGVPEVNDVVSPLPPGVTVQLLTPSVPFPSPSVCE